MIFKFQIAQKNLNCMGPHNICADHDNFTGRVGLGQEDRRASPDLRQQGLRQPRPCHAGLVLLAGRHRRLHPGMETNLTLHHCL